MSGGRQVKKQLKLREPEPLTTSDSSSDSDEAPTNAFAMLNESSSSSESSSDDSVVKVDVPKPIIAKKQKSSSTIEDISVQELDEILKNQKWEVEETLPISPEPEKSSNLLFIVNPKKFDFESELNRQFGATSTRFTKAQLVQLKPNWPKFHSSGHSLQFIDSEYQYVHSKQYQEVEFQFLNFFTTMDVQSIFQLLQIHPTHLNSLLLISEQHRQSDIDSASDLIQRGLLLLQKSLKYTNMTFSYAIEENASLFIFLLKHVYYLNRKGAWQAAFEVCKFILSLNSDDPFYVGSLIDFQAVMAKEYSWLDDYIAVSDIKKYPNLLYTQALSLFMQQKSSDLILKKAFINYPAIGNELLGNQSDDLYAMLYKQQHSKLWTEQKIQYWLNSFKSKQFDIISVKPSESVYRMIIVMDYDLIKFIPEDQRPHGHIFMPFPEKTGKYSEYINLQLKQRNEIFNRQNISNDTHPLAGLFQTLLPWMNPPQDE